METDSEMLMPLFSILDDIEPAEPALKNLLQISFYEQIIPKGKLLLYEGEVCKSLWFLIKGILRSFHNIGDKDHFPHYVYGPHCNFCGQFFYADAGDGI